MTKAQLKQRIEKLQTEVAYLRQQHPTQPTCAGRCGATDNLTEVIATPDSPYMLCPRCKAEEQQS